jgi:preprotein translocase subunit SecD
MKFVEERTVGPSLGKENIELGMKSIIIGLASSSFIYDFLLSSFWNSCKYLLNN